MISIRKAEENDFDFYYNLKSEDFNVFWGGAEKAPDYEKLKSFFINTVQGFDQPNKRKLYIIYDDEVQVGEISIKPKGEDCEMPLSLLEDKVGCGRGRAAYKLGLDEAKKNGFKRVFGVIREDNEASLMLHLSLGARFTGGYTMVYIPKLKRDVKMIEFIIEM
jgi:RimJ/RimL family protein N-acetyltransferase